MPAVAPISCLTSLQFGQAIPKLHERTLCFPHFFQAARRHVEVLLRSPAALCRRLAELRCDEALILQSLEGGINTADSYIPAGSFLELFADWNAVGVVAQAYENQYYHQFEASELLAFRHFF